MPDQPDPSHPPDSDRTAAVVLNHGTPDETCAAVASIDAAIPDPLMLVIDTGSAREAASLQQRLPRATVIATLGNLGFAGGCNAGIRHALDAGAARVLLLNSDATLLPGAWPALRAALDRADVGIAGGLIVTPARVPRVESAGIDFHAGTGRMRHRRFGHRADALRTPGVVVVDGVSGCAMLIRREVFERAGLLDEAFFFGFEDLEFCLRARRAGFASVCVESAGVAHAGSLTIGPRSPQRIYFGTRNHLRLISGLPGRTGRGARLVRAGSVLALSLAHALMRSNTPLWPGIRAWYAGARDHFRGRYGPGPGDRHGSPVEPPGRM